MIPAKDKVCLARQDSEGHRLVEVAALTETLLIDEQQVYNPLLPDDRLMLGKAAGRAGRNGAN